MRFRSLILGGLLVSTATLAIACAGTAVAVDDKDAHDHVAAASAETGPATRVAGEWTSKFTPPSIEHYGHDFIVWGTPTTPNPAGCSNSGQKTRLHPGLDNTDEGRALDALLLTALAAGKEVQLKIHATDCAENGGARYFYAVWIHR